MWGCYCKRSLVRKRTARKVEWRLSICEKLFADEAWMRSVLFHEMLHLCKPPLHELEIEMIEYLCDPNSDRFESEDLKNVYPNSRNDLEKTDPFDWTDPVTKKRLLVFDTLILDPVTGEAWYNSGSRSFPKLGQKLLPIAKKKSPFVIPKEVREFNLRWKTGW